MSSNTVKQLAMTVKMPVKRLLDKLKQAGITVSTPDQTLSAAEKQKLITYLQQKKPIVELTAGDSMLGQATPVIRKPRKTISTLKVRGSSGAVTITHTRKRVYITPPQEEERIKEEEIQATEQLTPVSIATEAGTSAASSVVQLPAELAAQAIEPKQIQSEVTQPESLRTTTKLALAAQTKLVVDKKKADVNITKLTSTREDKKPRNLVKEKVTKHRRPTRDLLEESDEQSYVAKARKFPKKSSREALLKQAFERPVAPVVREVSVPETITVADLAQKMSIKVAEVIKQLMKLGIRAMINQRIDQDTAVLLVEEMGHIAKPMAANALETHLQQSTEEHMGEALPRPPVVTIMGHVDHGKTSLLDYIRRAKVASGEAGGITQHIGAYHVEIPKGVITFLDTPGHAAFTAMRARGARLTDIVALIVAADDGVMPQTVEAIQHAQAANVPIVVVINKIDKPGADIDRIQQELAKYQLVPEVWGGDTLFVPVSAKTGAGIDELLDALLVQAEILELKAARTGPAQGIIIESRLEKGRGPVVSVLVQQGTLRKGDILLAGVSFGRVRALHDENGQTVLSTGPSLPVEVLGLTAAATAGDEAVVVANERKAREIALFRFARVRDSRLKSKSPLSVQDFMSQMDDTKTQKALNIVLKADVQGSAEALSEALTRLSTTEIHIRLLATGVGAITESDVNLALASKALVLGFNVRADHAAKQIVERENLPMHYHTVIYDLLDQVKQVMSGLLAPLVKETVLGSVIVREVFRAAKIGTIAGCYVTEGLVRRGHPIRVLRDNVIVHQGDLHSLRRFKEDVNEVRVGTECGIGIKNYTEVQVGDIIEVYERITVARTI